MTVSCPGLPPKILIDDALRPTRKHTPRMAALAVGFAVCSLFVQLVNIESFSSRCAIQSIAQPPCIRQVQLSCQELSLKKSICEWFVRVALITLTMS